MSLKSYGISQWASLLRSEFLLWSPTGIPYQYQGQYHAIGVGTSDHEVTFYSVSMLYRGFPGGLDSKESASRVRGSIPVSGRSPGRGHGNPLQYPCLENFMDRGAQWATVCKATKSQTHWVSLSTNQKTVHTLQPSPKTLPIKTSLWKPLKSSVFLSKSCPFSWCGPAMNLSLLQTSKFRFVWSHRASSTWTWIQ